MMNKQFQTLASTKSNFLVTKYALRPLKSIHGNFQFLSNLSFFLSFFSSYFNVAPFIIRNLMISAFPYKI